MIFTHLDTYLQYFSWKNKTFSQLRNSFFLKTQTQGEGDVTSLDTNVFVENNRTDIKGLKKAILNKKNILQILF